MAPIYKVAAVQMHSKPLQIENNYSKAADYIKSAASQGAKLVVLNEYALTSWAPQDPGWVELSDQSEKYLQKFCNLAKELQTCIVPGTIIERQKDVGTGESGLLNVAYFIDDRGNILHRYIKKNLWHPERPHLASSTHDPHFAFDTPVGRTGMLICWDLAFPEAFRELIADGAKLIIIPSFWTLNDCSEEGLKWNPSAEAVFLDSFLTTRAYENTCAVIFANAGGPPGRGYAGLSQVTIPFVGPIARLGSGGEGMIVVSLDLGVADIAEANYRVREDLAREDWHYDYRHKRTENSKL